MKSIVALCIMGLLMGAVHGLTKHAIQTHYYNQALGTSPSTEQHATEYRRKLPCNAQVCAPHHNTRKVKPAVSAVRPSLPKQEVGKVIRIVNTINARNQRAAQAGMTND